MTHAGLTDSDRCGFASPCPGELAHQGDFFDEVVTSEGTTTRTISLWVCQGCGYALSGSNGRVLNCYPPPARVVAAVKEGG